MDGLKRYVEQLTYEQGKALREMATPSKPTPIMSKMRRGVAFEKPVDHWEQRLSDIDPEEEADERSPVEEPMPMITPQILQKRAGFEAFQEWYVKEGMKDQQGNMTEILSNDSFRSVDGHVGMDMLLVHLCEKVLRIRIESVIYHQDEVRTLIDLVTMPKEDIFGVEDRDEK